MHYIRFLRAPKLTFQGDRKNAWSLNVVLTVTTDLGDSFLAHDEPVKIKVSFGWEQPLSAGKSKPMRLAGEKTLRWASGMRVLKADIPAQHLESKSRLPQPGADEGPLRVYAWAGSGVSAETAANVSMAGFNDEAGRIMPLWTDIQTPGSVAPTTCLRRLRLGDRSPGALIEVEEDIGESIARHLWDAGIMVVSRLWLLSDGDPGLCAGHPLAMNTLEYLLLGSDAVNILELGCGVGIFGIGLARMLSREGGSDKSTILMTDLPEAEERAGANIDRLATTGAPSIRPEYENLDWDDGRQGDFGPQVGSRFWDLVVLSDCTYNADALPALIDTWTAIHKQNVSKRPGAEVTTRVLVAMKVRHADESRLWELVKEDGWAVAEQAVMPLPMLGGEPQEIFLHLFENKNQGLSGIPN
ncbi:upf0665 family protein c [Colletotrichum plurivorum]|uniref:Upf0665 family protein c n=1 Tax=Colletotrichum plurivorum TaxID=2175906 RepID=A0A8H6K8U3_9PEZI|nr:upf0665 family protein c [Colletotrichum plurivorum]